LLAAAYVGAVMVVLGRAASGRATAGDVALALALATALVTAAGRLSELAGYGLRAVTAAGHYSWLEDQAQPDAGAPPTVPAPSRLRHGIDLENVTFAYGGSGRAALRDVTLHLPAGAVVAIVGENGAGKTTLVKILGGMY